MASADRQPPRPEPFPLPKTVIWALCVVGSPLAGAFLYYAWRAKAPAAASYANRASWLSVGVWLLISLAFVGAVYVTHNETSLGCERGYPGTDHPVPTCEFRMMRGSGEICGTIVAVRRGTVHRARLCSGPLTTGHSRVVTPSFTPPLMEEADHIEIETE